jgi:hypothetical protein
LTDVVLVEVEEEMVALAAFVTVIVNVEEDVHNRLLLALLVILT